MPTSFIEHKGVRILLVDFSGIQAKEKALQEIAAAHRFVVAQPKQKSLRILCNVTGARWDTEIVEALKQFAKDNGPWVMASTIVGVTPIARVVIRGMLLLTGRKIGMMKSLDQAKDWLAAQTAPPEAVPDQI